MPYLYSPDGTVSGASFDGVSLEFLNGRVWVDSDEAVEALASHGLVPSPDQNDEPEDTSEPAAEGAAPRRRGRPPIAR